jgi:serine/threonine protein kinase
MPTSFVNGRYHVKKFLGEGGKKKVYLVHDEVLDRDVAFALINTEKLDDVTRVRISREAQVMGRLGDHHNIMTVHDMGEEKGQSYIVLPLMPGGDVESLIEKAPERRLPIEQAVGITKAVCRGLEYRRFWSGAGGRPVSSHERGHDGGHVLLHAAGAGHGW